MSAKQEEPTEDERMTGNKNTVLVIVLVIQAACSRIGKLVYGRSWRGNFWFPLRFFIQFLTLWSMDEKLGKLENRAEAEFKIALAKHYLCLESKI